MIYLLFVAVANIANNLNNNNNNQNDNNLNYVNQQNNNLNMNQNIVNQLNIDLPPPVPGKRSAEQTRAYHHQVTSCVGRCDGGVNEPSYEGGPFFTFTFNTIKETLC